MKRFFLVYLVLAGICFALYEEQAEPARVFGMGSAVVATGEGVSVVPFNPAIAAHLDRYAFSGTYSSRWSLDGFMEYSAAFVLPLSFGTAGAFWHERSVKDVYGERTASLVFARRIAGKLDGGLSAKMFITSAPGADLWADPSYEGPKYNLCADVGLLYMPFEKWRFGIATRSLGEPDIALLSSSELSDSPGGQVAIGLSWEIAEDLVFAGDLVSEEGNLHRWTPRVGMEIVFFDILAVRAGSKGERLSMGAGLNAKNWDFDIALSNHRWLGNIYRFTFTAKY
ncbi:hypothetical protein KAH81_06915 [bacterium]|nr:hypothetical protein [bacterium]